MEIIEKIKNAKAIKVIGKAGLDTYAGDVTVIANTIIETNTDVPEPPEEEDEEDTPLILGTSENITEELVKVQDLGVDDGKIALQGEVIFTEDRTLKSGKTLFSFDLYDGTSTITCKAFLDKDKAKKIMKRIKVLPATPRQWSIFGMFSLQTDLIHRKSEGGQSLRHR